MDTSAISKEYIDVDDALKRVGGNEALYKKLLGRFIEGNYLEPICSAIQSGDMEEAAKSAHTLKGVSANLSLVKIQLASVELEHAIKDGLGHNELLETLKQAFDATLEQVAEVMK